MSQVKVKIPVAQTSIWKSKGNYIWVVKDRHLIDFLLPYVGKQVEIEIAGISIRTRLIRLTQKGTFYIGSFLPRRLAPTWEKLRQKSNEYNAVIVITERNDGEQA
ncbi:MAG: hypothetical protein AT713_05940 [Caldivirga sp. JCHS_4]|jgi:hypothetical protein|nr:MAG: hypothetical protein AT713_05940 [Caldivirga sp. JCHS_4]